LKKGSSRRALGLSFCQEWKMERMDFQKSCCGKNMDIFRFAVSKRFGGTKNARANLKFSRTWMILIKREQ
jgi:hypothetical protein